MGGGIDIDIRENIFLLPIYEQASLLSEVTKELGFLIKIHRGIKE